jgi:hypothetical protein
MSNLRPTARRRASAAVAGAALALVLAACIPPAPPTTTITTSTTTSTSTTVPGCVPEPASVTQGGVTLSVSQATCLEVGDEVTVTGSGYTTTGNLGTRPPLQGQPGGVYVLFGEFADPWRPSQGAAGAARRSIVQQWALPASSYAFMSAFGQPGLVQMTPQGGFTTTLTIEAPVGQNPTLGIATYAGSGSVNAGEELLVPVSFG